jgi:CubicO group peptidase (beta-lactamase class C family)
MSTTSYSPGLDCEICAPTGRLRDQSLYRGRPFDPVAQRLDGVAGNAGLFGSVADVARFMAMVANGGELDGVRVLSAEAVAEFTRPQPVGGNGRFRLGWEVSCDLDSESAAEECRSSTVIGHTGWTGTSIQLDLDTGLWVVILTNRTYEPRAPNRIQAVRRAVSERAFEIASGEWTSGVVEPER